MMSFAQSAPTALAAGEIDIDSPEILTQPG